MRLSNFRFFTLVAFSAILAPLLVAVSFAQGVSDAEVERLFNRHKDSDWKPLAERWEKVKSKMNAPIENLSLPLEYYPNGLVKARIYAEKAQIFTLLYPNKPW